MVAKRTIAGQKFKMTILSLFIIIITIQGILWKLKTRPRHVNIILITIDALRYDHLGCYGYERDVSPHIDSLAKEGALFTQAICQGGWTWGSLASLMTSNYPATAGAFGWGYSLNPSLPTLASLLKNNGYYTAAINGHRLAERLSGVGASRGFDVWEHRREPMDAAGVTRKATDFLQNNCTKKFFLWLHYFDTHMPYAPPYPYNSMFLGNDIKTGRPNIPLSRHLLQEAVPSYTPKGDIRDIDYLKGQYDGAMRYIDDQVGVLLHKLVELGLHNKTMVIITADHGELFGEHGSLFGHRTLYEENIRVPLIIWCKNVLSTSATIRQQVASIDIAPTILASLGIIKDRRMHGENLLPVIRGRGNHSAYTFSEEVGPRKDFFRQCVRSEGWKLIYNKQDKQELYELYNLTADPSESRNLKDTERKKFSLLKRKLEDWRDKTPVFRKEIYPLRPGDYELLKGLGYLN